VSPGRTHDEPQNRRERLRAIAAEYTEEIHERPTGAQLGGTEPVFRFAAVTSEGSIESSHAANGNLIVADSTGALAERLRQECSEGWLAHGRAWDLDAPWHSWGNLEVAYRAEVGGELARHVHAVVVSGREEAIHLFDDLVDAEAFAVTVAKGGGETRLSEHRVHDHRSAEQLIDAERGSR
jgi:hypothetical protein